MSLVAMSELLADAKRGGYAVCYCESWNLESIQAVLEAAEEEHSPIIAGFNGGFLRHPGRTRAENLAFYAGFGLAIREARIPVAFILNETPDFAQIEEALDLGFNAIMVENEGFAIGEYLPLVKRVVTLAHRRGASVEAQVGHLADASGNGNPEPTSPEVAQAFVEETGIDALSVAVGNVHILTQGKAELDLEALATLGRSVRVPLVLHGGTGIPLEMAERCVRLGVAKVNFGTALKQVYLAAVREKLANYREPMSPHPFLGMGGPNDVLVAAKNAVKSKVKELLRAFASAGKTARKSQPILGIKDQGIARN
ncbi:MAG: class II fructose-bisphosphate aldolase [Acidobacteriia bacterium]|nr:class II fructose-bisphosphate aldolase [Terriglobia bacterium]